MPRKYDGAQKPYNPYSEIGGIIFNDALEKSFFSAMNTCERPYHYKIRSGHWHPMGKNTKWVWDEPPN